MVDLFYVGNQKALWQMVDELEQDKHSGWRCKYSKTLDEAIEAIKDRKERNKTQIRIGVYVLVNYKVNKETTLRGLKAGAHYVFGTSDKPRDIVRVIEDAIHRKRGYGEIVENGVEEKKQEEPEPVGAQ